MAMSLQERIDNGEFNNKAVYPSKEVLDEKHQGKRKRLEEIIREEARIKEEMSKTRRELYQLYNEGGRDAIQRFREALEKEFDMEKHPKKDMLWEKAWEDGHSSGYDEILDVYEDLVELVK